MPKLDLLQNCKVRDKEINVIYLFNRLEEKKCTISMNAEAHLALPSDTDPMGQKVTSG